ncbi:YxeA family protein [Staphylococcus sp. GSSP0090]|nr:YxeA family protein [Staphylococcus sp. GSSP0090]
MKKSLIVTLILFALLTVAFFSFDEFDRFNPLIKKETSYAIVKLNTQNYKNVTIYSEQGIKRNYKVSFKGYIPSQQYIKLKHKGTYVEHIEYISKQTFPSLK